jgi:DNA invertase Pin-like site-specific DNA recombinase
MRRAAIYARYSTEHQSDKSIDDQVVLCRRHAEREGLRVAKVYSDRAQSSATLHGRRGIADLLDDARGGAFDAVIVESLDRISRDQADLATVYKRLAFQGIDIVTVNEGRANNLLVGLRGLIGGIDPRDTRDKVHRGMQGVVRDGRSAGGRAYGYRPVPGRPGALEIVEHEAEVIRRIHALYLDGHGPKAIAGTLNRGGRTPPRGTKWNASTINGSPKSGYGLLSNPLYDERQVWNRVGMARDPDTGRRISRDKPLDEWMEEPAEHLRIILAEVFTAVQARRQEQSIRKAEGRPVERAVRPFSGLLRCALCGKGMAVH